MILILRTARRQITQDEGAEEDARQHRGEVAQVHGHDGQHANQVSISPHETPGKDKKEKPEGKKNLQQITDHGKQQLESGPARTDTDARRAPTPTDLGPERPGRRRRVTARGAMEAMAGAGAGAVGIGFSSGRGNEDLAVDGVLLLFGFVIFVVFVVVGLLGRHGMVRRRRRRRRRSPHEILEERAECQQTAQDDAEGDEEETGSGVGGAGARRPARGEERCPPRLEEGHGHHGR